MKTRRTMNPWANTRTEKILPLVSVGLILLSFLSGGLAFFLLFSGGLVLLVASGIMLGTGPFARENQRARAEVRRRIFEIENSLVAAVKSLGPDLDRKTAIEAAAGRRRFVMKTLATIILSVSAYGSAFLVIWTGALGLLPSDPVGFAVLSIPVSIFLIPLLVVIWSKDPKRFPYRFACQQARDFLDSIDGKSGATRQPDVRVEGRGGDEDRWVKFFIEQELVTEVQESDRSRKYVKTEFGREFHDIMRNPSAVRVIINRLSPD